MRKSPNIYQQLTITEPEQAFVSDITYLESAEGIHYLSLVTDAGSRKIMGYHLSDDMKAESVSQALREAISNRLTDKPLIHHSDRGLQYCSAHYREILDSNGIASSMTDGYDCYQNALAERVNGILKNEFLIHKYRTR
ncbi:MAG: IS3 family transposase, partial [Oceanospirillaceae bacterium]|nr:IS3 family transposase [Oceanospirillaceae bacterium]